MGVRIRKNDELQLDLRLQVHSSHDAGATGYFISKNFFLIQRANIKQRRFPNHVDPLRFDLLYPP